MYEKETSSNYWKVQIITKWGKGELKLASDWGRVWSIVSQIVMRSEKQGWKKLESFFFV